MRGERLKEIRLKRNYTQEELAERIGVGTQQIWRWESESTKPSSELLGRLAKELSVNADYLLGTSDDPTSQFRIDNLTDVERHVIAAMRRGERLEAIKAIVESN